MLDIQIIRNPSTGVRQLLKNRTRELEDLEQSYFESIGLVQGKLISIISAMDIAEKSADVKALEIRGTCPQHILLIAIIGSTAAVEAAINNILEWQQNMEK